jgi:hypothetical protein
MSTVEASGPFLQPHAQLPLQPSAVPTQQEANDADGGEHESIVGENDKSDSESDVELGI